LPTAVENLRLYKETSLTGIVRDEITRMIEAGELLPGAWVNEAELAQRFGVSRGPVREACRGLEQIGLLRFVVNRGAFVREIDLNEAAELYDLRSALFALAGRLLAPIIDSKGLSLLEGLLAQMEAAAAAGDLEAYYPLNLQFHRAILELAGNARLHSAYQNCVRELHLFRRSVLISKERMKSSNLEHKAIFKALKSRDAAKAFQLMQDHVLGAKARVLREASSHSDGC
jgi:DNA-binding GntR family transcriptional regulator